ncbi:MAG: type II toxin-antitoxin system VapC family toxin [Planctomycetota bacterium]
MIILDTNVVSVFMKEVPDEAVVAWLDRQPAGSEWTTAITVFEVEYGLHRLPEGQRRKHLEAAFHAMIHEDLGGRVLPFDTPAAMAAGPLVAALQARGFNTEIRDMQIAGIARVRNAPEATRNVRDFEQACVVRNPWEEA